MKSVATVFGSTCAYKSPCKVYVPTKKGVFG